MEDKIVEKITEVDYQDITFAIWAVFENTIEYPGKCVARLFDLDKPTNVVIIQDTLAEMQDYFSAETPLYFCKRGAGDVPDLVGVWI